MQKNYDVIIIGGGIQGLSLAYNLAKKGLLNVAVFEKSYLGSGASSRNGEMVRSAFASGEWIRLFNKSLKIWETLSHEIDFNVMFTRRGYLILASSPEKLEACRTNVKQQNKLGVDTYLLTGEEVKKLVPALNPCMAAGGIFHPKGGFARHDAAVWGYARAARRLKVDIFPYTEVTGIIVKSGAVKGVGTSQGNIETRIVVNAAGAHAGRVAGMVGLKLPLEIHRLEMIVTEPIKPFLRPAVSSQDTLSYMHQTTRGEFVGGAEVKNLAPFTSLKSTREAVQDMACKFTHLFPGLSGVRLMRQWAGIVSKTPDRAALLGPVKDIEGFILSAGWGGYGFMGAPVGGKLMAEFILSGEVPPEIKPFNLERFKTGKLIIEPSLIGQAKIKTTTNKCGSSPI